MISWIRVQNVCCSGEFMNLKWIEAIFALVTSNNIFVHVDLLTVFHSSTSIQFNYFYQCTGNCYLLLMLWRKITGKSFRRTNAWNDSNSVHVWPSQWKRARMRIETEIGPIKTSIYSTATASYDVSSKSALANILWRSVCFMATKFNLLLSTIFDLIPNAWLLAKFVGHHSFRINWKRNHWLLFNLISS